LIRQKILDSTVDEVLEELSMHVAPQAIRIVLVPTVVTVLLGLHNPSHSWTGTVGPSLPGFTIALACIPWLAMGCSGSLSLSFKTVPKSKVHVCIYTIAFELSS
jgi:hypothetical protein